MATIKAVVRPARASKKTGECKVEIAISHKKQTKFFPTNHSVLPEHFYNGMVGRKVPNYISINADIANTIADWYGKLEKVHNQNFYDLDTLLHLAQHNKSNKAMPLLTFSALLKMCKEELEEEGKTDKYISMLDRSYSVMQAFCPTDVLVADIDSGFVSTYQKWMLTKRKLSKSTCNMYLSHLKSCINRAINNGWVKYENHPFSTIKIGKSDVKDNRISLEELRRYRDMPLQGMQEKARDIFMLSFYLAGMNLKDMLACEFDLNSLYIEYVRAKTQNKVKQAVQVPLCHEAKEILAKYLNESHRIDLGWQGSYVTQLCNISKNIKRACSNATIYSARKTFAQTARQCGADMTVVDYLLAHSDTSQGVIRHYVRPEFKVSAVTMRKILDYVANPNDIEDEYQRLIARL